MWLILITLLKLVQRFIYLFIFTSLACLGLCEMCNSVGPLLVCLPTVLTRWHSEWNQPGIKFFLWWNVNLSLIALFDHDEQAMNAIFSSFVVTNSSIGPSIESQGRWMWSLSILVDKSLEPLNLTSRLI